MRKNRRAEASICGCGIRNNASMEPTTRSLKSGSDTRGHDKSVEMSIELSFCTIQQHHKFLENNFCRKFYPNLRYLRLDRRTRLKKGKIIHAFNSDRKYTFLLTTTRVGGLGINSGRGRYGCVLNDWNPQKDLQAMDRVHRLGQTRVTNVNAPLCKDTIEKKRLCRCNDSNFTCLRLLLTAATAKYNRIDK